MTWNVAVVDVESWAIVAVNCPKTCSVCLRHRGKFWLSILPNLCWNVS